MKENAKILKGFPYHSYPHETTDPIKIIKFPDNYEFTSDELRILEARFKKEKKISDNILASGLFIDEDYNVFVNSEYGAFFYNTKCKSIQEEIASCQNMPPIMNYHVYVPQEELLGYIDAGYEFVIGPSVKIFDNDDDSLCGVYCSNYNKTLGKKR